MKVKHNQTVLVNKRSNGAGRLEKAADSVQRIVGLYLNGNVRTESGDVWAIRPHDGPEANFVVIG